MSSPKLKQAVPLFMVTDMESSLTFYVIGLGFEVKMEWRPEGRLKWCWVERDGVAIMLQEYPEGSRPDDTLGVGVSIFVLCEDAISLYKEFRQRGMGPAEPFVGNKMWVVLLVDPDGYGIHFESMTEVPEGTKYSEWMKQAPS